MGLFGNLSRSDRHLICSNRLLLFYINIKYLYRILEVDLSRKTTKKNKISLYINNIGCYRHSKIFIN